MPSGESPHRIIIDETNLRTDQFTRLYGSEHLVAHTGPVVLSEFLLIFRGLFEHLIRLVAIGLRRIPLEGIVTRDIQLDEHGIRPYVFDEEHYRLGYVHNMYRAYYRYHRCVMCIVV